MSRGRQYPLGSFDCNTGAECAGFFAQDDSYEKNQTGTAVFLAGLKNGNFATVAKAFSRTASIVTSICNLVPGCEYAVSRLARAIIFFSTGDQVVEVAFPTWRLPE
jgi:hypothetical protein